MIIRGERLHFEQDKKHSFVLEHIQRYQFATQFAGDKIVLDLGCGEGYGTKILKDAGAKQVVGVDINKEVIEQAKNDYLSEGVLFRGGDAQSLEFKDESFDLVVSLELIEHLQNYQHYLQEVKRVLKSPGIFILSTPNKDNYRGQTSPFHIKEFNLEELQEIVKLFFKKVEIFGQRITNPEIVESEERFFKYYQKLTFHNPLIKKLLLLIPGEFKAFFHRKVLVQSTPANEKDFKISKEKLSEALTFLAVCRK